MKKFITQSLLAAAIGGATLIAAPANAASVSISIGFPGVGFSYNSGGYCDTWGCPSRFWNYPIYYCPVYYNGRWYSGPAYYRYTGGRYQYWIHGGWRRDSWNRTRPRGACVDRYGPPLDLDFYIWNGFNVRDQWRYSWNNQRNDWWNRRQQWDRTNRNATNWQSWVPAPQQSYDWNRQRSWNTDREWTRPDWNRADWERKNNIQRSGAGPFGGVRPIPNTGGSVAPPPTMAPVVTPPASSNAPADRGGRKGGKDNQGAGGSSGGTVTPPSQMAPVVTPPASTNGPSDKSGRKGGKDNQGAGGSSGGAVTQKPPTSPAVTAPTGDNATIDKKADHKKGKNDKGDKKNDQNNPQ